MLLVLLSWCYIFFTVFNLGFAVNKTARLKCDNFVIITFFGLVATTILASIWAIFGRINIEFHCFLLLCNVSLLLRYQNEIAENYRFWARQLETMPKSSKWNFSTIFVLLLLQSAAPSHSV